MKAWPLLAQLYLLLGKGEEDLLQGGLADCVLLQPSHLCPCSLHHLEELAPGGVWGGNVEVNIVLEEEYCYNLILC